MNFLNYEMPVIKNYKQLLFYIKNNELENDISESLTGLWKEKETGGCIFQFDYKDGLTYTLMLWKNNRLSTLSHELMHAVDFLCKRKGIDDSETRAYMMGYFMKQAIEEFSNVKFEA